MQGAGCRVSGVCKSSAGMLIFLRNTDADERAAVKRTQQEGRRGEHTWINDSMMLPPHSLPVPTHRRTHVRSLHARNHIIDVV